MRHISPKLSCLYFVLFLISCGEPGAKHSPATADEVLKGPKDSYGNSIPNHKPVEETKEFQTGKVNYGISIKSAPAQSYALYLPSYYTSVRKWPVIYIFDSHARGRLPLERYQGLAETYGYVLVGSNYSKNGMDWETTLNHIDALLADTYKRLSIAADRIYAMGFSGGARVAVSMAIYKGNLAGVTGCAAGFPQLDKPINEMFPYMAFSGNRDFNFPEMIRLDEELDKMGFPHLLAVFDGKHEWPDVQTMQKAFSWMELSAIRTGPAERRDSLIDNLYVKDIQQMQQLEKNGRMLELDRHYKMMAAIYENLKDVSDILEKQNVLEKGESFKKEVKAQAETLLKEAKIDNSYAQAMVQKDLDWWVQEVGRVTKFIEAEKDPLKKNSFQRVFGYLSLMAYLQTEAALNQGNLALAKKFLTIFQLVDADNPDQYFLSAVWHAKMKDDKNALTDLSKAVKMGFDDFDRLRTEPSLSSIRAKLEYQDILNSISPF